MNRISASLATLMLLAATPVAGLDYADESLPDPQQEAKAVQLMDSLRCVVCQGQPISGSNAGLAGDMRRLVRERIAAGDSPEQVRAWLVNRYGDWISFQPQVKPATAPLWLIPLLAVLAGSWLASRRLVHRKR